MIGILAAVVVAVIAIIALVSYNANKPLSNGMTKDEGEKILATGIAYFDNGQYEEAIQCFAQLPTDSKQYEEAHSMLTKSSESYRESILDKVDTYVQNGEYEVALELLKNAQTVLPDDSELKNAYNSTFNSYKLLISSTAITKADEYAADGDYESAIKTVGVALDKIGQDEELSAKLAIYQNDYRTGIIAQADKALSQEGYQSATSIINQGLTVLPKDSAMLEKLSEYETYIPVDLFGLETFSGNPTFKVGALTDTFGNENNQVYLKMTNRGDDEFSYLLNGEYNTLSGTLLWSKEYKNDDRGWYCFMFYDGDRLLYTTSQCSSTSGPVEFSANITNVQILTVKIDGFSNKGPFEMGTTVTVQK